MGSFEAFSQLAINKEIEEEQEKLAKEAKDKGLAASLMSAIGSLTMMGLTAGMVNPLTIGGLTSLGSFVGGKIGGATKKISKGYDWLQDEAEDIREEIADNVLVQAIGSGLSAGMSQATNLALKGQGWGSLTKGWEKTPIGRRQRIKRLAAESGISPKDINWDIIRGDYSDIEAGNIAATESLATERLDLAKEFAGETFMEGTGLEGLPPGADYETSKRYYDATHDFPMEFTTESGEVTGSIPAGTDLRTLDAFAKGDIPQPGKLRPWPWEQGPKFKDGQVMPLDSRFKPVRMPGPPSDAIHGSGGQPVQMPQMGSQQLSDMNWEWLQRQMDMYDENLRDLIRTENRSLYDYYQKGLPSEEFDKIYEGFDRSILDLEY